jgi:hypothetical protein
MKRNIVNEVHAIVMREMLYESLSEKIITTLEGLDFDGYDKRSEMIGVIAAWRQHYELIKGIKND